MDRYEKWRQAHPDGVDMDTTPNVRTQQLANENTPSQQESWIRDEEAARAARQQARLAAEEASRWVQQRQDLEQDARSQEMAASASLKYPLPPTVLPQPPDLSFSRPNVQIPVTVVPTDGTGDHYNWSRRKCRAVETCSSSADQDFCRLGMDSNNKRSRLKSSYPPSVTTTTSPVPRGGPICYSALMTQHQRTQGYYPSLSSMFAESANRQQGSSLLQVLTANSNDARVANSTSHWAPNPPNQQPHRQVPPHPHTHQQHGPQVTNPAAYMRPPPPLPSSSTSETFAQSQLQTESNRIIQASDPNFDSTKPLKSVSLPRECFPRFLAIAKVNTEMNKETCGLLLGKDIGLKYSVTMLLIPKQTSTSDTCTMLEEELVLQFTEERSLVTLGWVSFITFAYTFLKLIIEFLFVRYTRILHNHVSLSTRSKKTNFSPTFFFFVRFHVFCGPTYAF